MCLPKDVSKWCLVGGVVRGAGKYQVPGQTSASTSVLVGEELSKAGSRVETTR
jgi:hypothetical protein